MATSTETKSYEYIGSGWTKIASDDVWHQAREQARGDYQDDVLCGYESLSGSTLKGKAASYGGRYAKSRAALLDRLTKAGIPWSVSTEEHGKRVLVLG